MPLVAFSQLPTYQRLMQEHHDVLPLEKAEHQDIRELHIGLLNMMPDATLQATERQFMRLVGDCNQIVQFYVHLFTVPEIPRSAEAQDWISRYYETFDDIKAHGLDALIISGANPQSDQLENEPFWPMLTEVIDWATENVTSTLCACLATHAVVQYRYGIKREKLPAKKWGVYQHKLTKTDHPLTRHTNTRFDVPHSRFNQITQAQLNQAGLQILASSEQAGVHLATSEDGIRLVFFQGHPEYDDLSLLKEYKREIDRWIIGERTDYPPFPDNYYNPEVIQILTGYKNYLLANRNCDDANSLIDWPEEWLCSQLDNTWRDTALSTFNNWLGLVYQLTDQNPRIPFMPGVDPTQPLKGL